MQHNNTWQHLRQIIKRNKDKYTCRIVKTNITDRIDTDTTDITDTTYRITNNLKFVRRINKRNKAEYTTDVTDTTNKTDRTDRTDSDMSDSDISDSDMSDSDVSDSDMSDRDMSDRDMSDSDVSDRDMSFMTDISLWDVSNVTYISDMFRTSTFNIDISSWNVESIINPYLMSNNRFSTNVIIDNFKEIEEEVLNKLNTTTVEECSICQEISDSYILSCFHTHVVCKTCITHINICPLCRTPID